MNQRISPFFVMRYTPEVAVLAFFSAGCGDTPQHPAAAPAAEVREVAAAPGRSSITVADRKAAALARLDRLKGQRLTIVQQVAVWKWIRQKPIEDPARESALLDSVEKQAIDLGLEPGPARDFFAALIADARNFQNALHSTWRRDGPPPDMKEPDLDELRRGIDRLTPQLLEAWAETRRD